MNIDLRQLEMNVNLHSLQPGFLNRELHYVLASGENNFRFVEADEKPVDGEEKFYCYLSDKQLTIPAGNITLNKSYSLQRDPPYAVLTTAADFFPFVDCIDENCTGKAIRNFIDADINPIFEALKQRYGGGEKHLVTSPEFQHLLIILPQVEISISATMVYFKQKTPITREHYEHLKEEKSTQPAAR